MAKINIRKSLKHMDEDTFCKYDLTTMYDSCVLDDEDKKVLAKMLYDKEDPEVIYQKLCMYFDDDQVADIDSYLMDTPVVGKYESLINKCVNKLSENYTDVSYNDVANQLEFNDEEQAYVIGVCPFEDVDTDDYKVFIDYNYDSPCCFNSEEEALKYILNYIKNKVNHIDDSDIQNCDDEMVYTVYDIVEDDNNRLVAKCMNESTNDFEDIKLGKTNTNKVIELVNNMLNNPNYKVTNEVKQKILKNSAPWGLAVQMTPSVDVDGTNGLLATGDFSGEASFGESVEESFEKDDRVTDGDRQGTVLDCDSQKVLVEWDYSDTDDIEWVNKEDIDIIINSEKQTNEGTLRLKESESKTGYYRVSYEKNGIYQFLIIKASSTADAENRFKDKYFIKPTGISPIRSQVELDGFRKRHVPIVESSNMYFTCPSCENKTLSSIDGEVKIPADVDYHDKFICDECGEEFLSEPQFNGKIKFVYDNLNESIPSYKKEEFKKQLQDELYDTFIQLAKTPKWGFETIKEIDELLIPVIEVNDYKGDYDNDFVAEVRGEFTYDDLEDIADSLDPIVQKYDKEAYFEPVTSGITRAYIKIRKNINESYYTGSDLRQANLDALEYLIEFEDIYPFPKGEFLADDWKELLDGVAMGMDDDVEIAEGIMEYLQKEIDFNNKHKEIYEDDPQAELTLEIYNKVKRGYEKEISRYESTSSKVMNEASYGGAFDIEDDMFFTRDDLVDFGEKVCEILGEIYPDTFDISDTYIHNNNILFLEVTSKQGNEGSANFKIDMRKIKKPLDLLKFADEMAFYLRQDLEELYTNNSIFTESASDWRYVASKTVPDSDGFLTDYTWYENTKDGRHVFIFGDNDLYDDVDSNYADWETDSYSEARSWFDNYHGFDEEDM